MPVRKLPTHMMTLKQKTSETRTGNPKRYPPLTLGEMHDTQADMTLMWLKLDALQDDMARGSLEYQLVESCQAAAEALEHALKALSLHLS